MTGYCEDCGNTLCNCNLAKENDQPSYEELLRIAKEMNRALIKRHEVFDKLRRSFYDTEAVLKSFKKIMIGVLMTDEKKPREFWIKQHPTDKNILNRILLYTATEEPPQNPGWLHVIEYSALIEERKFYESQRKLRCEEIARLEAERDAARKQTTEMRLAC